MIGAAADLPELVSGSRTSGEPLPDSSSKQSQAPRSAAAHLSRARSPVSTRRWCPRPARLPGGPGPARSTRSGAAAHPARPACSPPRTAHAPVRRSGPASSTGPATPRRPGRHPAPPPARAPAPGSACTRAPPALLEASACFPPVASARRHRFADVGDTGNLSRLPVAHAGLDQLRRGQPHPLAAARSAAVRPPLSGSLDRRSGCGSLTCSALT
jgi:hypothetical protein